MGNTLGLESAAVWQAEPFIGRSPESVPPLLCVLRRLGSPPGFFEDRAQSSSRGPAALPGPGLPLPPLPSSCSELLSIPQINHPPLTYRPVHRLIP